MEHSKISTYFEALGVSALAVFAPIQAVMLTAIALVAVDLVTGMMAARKRKEPVTSAGIRRTVTKVAVYETAIMTGFLAEHYMLSNALAVSKLVAGLIATAELKSILENLDAINGAPLFATIIAKLGSDNDQRGGGK